MATIVQLKHKTTGEVQSLFSIDARELLASPAGVDWEFTRRLAPGSKLVEPEIQSTRAVAGAIEFSGEAAEKTDMERSLQPKVGGSKRGQRGGGPQEPVPAPAE